MRTLLSSPLIFIILLLGALPVGAEVKMPAPLPDYTLEVSCDLKGNSLKGLATIDFRDEGQRNIDLRGLTVNSVLFNGTMFTKEALASTRGLLILTGKGRLIIDYRADFKPVPGEKQNPQNAGVVPDNLFGGKGIVLTGSGWYPLISGLAYYYFSAVVPKGFKAVSEAEEIAQKELPEGTRFTFSFPHALEGLDLVAAPYVVRMKRQGGTEIYSYFLPEDSALAEEYLVHAQGYLELYRNLLSPYPYKRFSIVENILPTGYSMPTFTLLGQAVVRLPFITETSLGHEILHQWFGNQVYGNPDKGNWLEGLTTYLADQLYQDQQGKGWEYRKKTLIDYRSYVTPKKESPLKDFKGRMDFASKAIGYGKGSMVFDMLRKEVGNDIFFKALRGLLHQKSFAEASWADIEEQFEDASGRELGWFFSEWLDRKDLPSFDISSPEVLFTDNSKKIRFELAQRNEPHYSFLLPVRVVTDKGEKKINFEIKKKNETVLIPVDLNERPLTIYVDDNYNLMRKLTDKEFPPVISTLLGAEKKLLVYSGPEKDKFSALIKILQDEDFTLIEEKEIKDADIKSASLLVLGAKSRVLERLFGKIEEAGPGFSLRVRKNPLNTDNVVAWAESDSAEETGFAARKIFHYGGYSSLRFERGNNVAKNTEASERGIRLNLRQAVPAVVPDSQTLETILPGTIQKPIIFIGERHTNYEDHKVELQVMEEMARSGRKFAIGMEMFQRPFQQSLNDYLAGKITEREFLKNSEYFKRWGFDYLLYRNIINFAKAWKIPVIALNVSQEIIKKVSQGGLDALSESERKEIPSDMDMSDYAYRERLYDIFKLHMQEAVTNFDYFYQSQILWDETMAHSIAEYLKKNPQSQMVVIAGGQHIAYGSGIPNRAYRLTGKEFTTLNCEPDDFKDVADFVLFPPPAEVPAAPRLGIQLKEEKKKIEIEKVEPQSAAEKAGMQKGDVLLEVDDWPISSIYDIKIALFDKKKGDIFNVKVNRTRFLRRAEILILPVTIK